MMIMFEIMTMIKKGMMMMFTKNDDGDEKRL